MAPWNKLSIKDKAEYIRFAVENGIYNLNEIKNSYALGGNFYGLGDKLKSFFAPTYKGTFEEAFGAARNDNREFFKWNGNRYNTQLKETEQPEVQLPVYDPEELALKQGWAESKFRKGAKSPAGAIGDYQIMPSVLKQYIDSTGITGDLTNSTYNRQVRDWYINWLSERPYLNKGNETVRLSKIYGAYNWGAGNMLKALNKAKDEGIDIYETTDWIDYLPKETKDYINFIVLNQDSGAHRTQQSFDDFKKSRK